MGDGKEKFGHCITADSGNSVGTISGHTAQINCVSIRQQRPLRAATAGDDASTVFYHGVPFKFNTSLKRHQRYVYGLGFSPDGSTLVSVGADRKIFLYDGKTGEAKTEIGDGEHKGSIFGVSWSSDSKRFTTCSADQTVKIWDAEAGKAIHTWRMGSDEGVVSIPDHQVGVTWPAARSDDMIISLALSGDLNYLSPSSAKPIRVVQGHQRNTTAIIPTPSQPPTLFTGSSDGRICAWSTDTGEATTVDGASHTNYVSGLASDNNGINENDRKIYSVAWDDSLRTISYSSTDIPTFTGSHYKTDGQPRGCATCSEGIVVVTHKGIALLSSSDNSVIKTLSTSFSPVAVAAAAHEYIAVAGDDNTLRIYSRLGLELKHTLPPFPSSISCLSFSNPAASNSDHPYLAIGFSSGRILVFSPTNQYASPVIERWSAQTARVTSISWDDRAERAVSGGLDTDVFVWSVKKPGGRVSTHGAHKEGVGGVCWVGGEADGKGNEGRVISVGGDGTVKAWRVEGVE